MLWLLSAVAAALTVWYIGAPLRGGEGINEVSVTADAPPVRRRDALEARREYLLRELKDLEFDHRTGKIDAEEYAELRAATAEEASAVLQELDAVRGERRGRQRAGALLNGARQYMAQEVEIEVLIARARRQMKARPVAETSVSSWQCACGRVMSDDDRFCASCGERRPAA
jgi:hypothetical protein